jgi:alpha/beta superfamily hydrolase
MAEQPTAMDVVEEEDVEIALHDVTLSGRIYRPQRREPADVPQPQSKSFAVIAHPWSRLGGSMDDRCVRLSRRGISSVSI